MGGFFCIGKYKYKAGNLPMLQVLVCSCSFAPVGCESIGGGGSLSCCYVLFLCVAGSFTVGCCYTVDWVLLFTVCSWFFHYIVGVHCKALVLLIGVILRIAIPLQ
jgi:hypothetical protein